MTDVFLCENTAWSMEYWNAQKWMCNALQYIPTLEKKNPMRQLEITVKYKTSLNAQDMSQT